MKPKFLTFLLFAITNSVLGQYCIPKFTSTNHNDGPITNVVLTGNKGQDINNTSSLGITSQGYSDFTSQVVEVVEVVEETLSDQFTISFSVTVAYVSGYKLSIWIDLNNDGIFQSAERVYHNATRKKTHIR